MHGETRKATNEAGFTKEDLLLLQLLTPKGIALDVDGGGRLEVYLGAADVARLESLCTRVASRLPP